MCEKEPFVGPGAHGAQQWKDDLEPQSEEPPQAALVHPVGVECGCGDRWREWGWVWSSSFLVAAVTQGSEEGRSASGKNTQEELGLYQ